MSGIGFDLIAAISLPPGLGVIATFLYFIMKKQDEQCKMLTRHDNMFKLGNRKMNIIGRQLLLQQIVMRKEHPDTVGLVFGRRDPVLTRDDIDRVFNDDGGDAHP